MSSEERKIRVLVAKPGLDGHDRGAKVIAASFRDAGFEVIYTGLHQTPEMIVNAAVEEDVDVVALSVLSGAHMTLFPRVLELLNEEGAEQVLLTGGGIIPEEDMEVLRKAGWGACLVPGLRPRRLWRTSVSGPLRARKGVEGEGRPLAHVEDSSLFSRCRTGTRGHFPEHCLARDGCPGRVTGRPGASNGAGLRSGLGRAGDEDSRALEAF